MVFSFKVLLKVYWIFKSKFLYIPEEHLTLYVGINEKELKYILFYGKNFFIFMNQGKDLPYSYF